ncbi:MAG: formate hydrogenlyase [Candidatus Aquicultor primus]|uniref:Formate hydrogenlyase n=1 Tax=Candidatus Aquicultor primus TaxID=1797195 RepID=A0A1F2UIV8_9ACTN|nr:MAG: formate hydrogenlyase [Candidatus Aquicultor primus]
MEALLQRAIIGIGHVVLVLLVSPLMVNLIKKIKAHFQCRRGPGLLQGYYDLWKLLKKDAVISEHASWIFRATPYVVFSATLLAAAIIPAFTVLPPIGRVGDVIAVIYLLGLARFFTALAGLDTASSFGGMGSSREMMISSLAEPVIITALFVLAITAGSTNLSEIISSSLTSGYMQPSYLLILLALLIVVIAETGRVPVDNPATHLELTMVHEAMVLEYTGRDLALIEWASSIKLMLLLTLIANVFLPWGIAREITWVFMLSGIAAIVIKVTVLASIIAVVESSTAKLRLFRVPELIGGSFALAMLALILRITGKG